MSDNPTDSVDESPATGYIAPPDPDITVRGDDEQSNQALDDTARPRCGPLRLDELPDIATASEVARFLRMSRGAVHDAARRGDLPAVRVGRRVLFPKAALVRLLDSAYRGRGRPRGRGASG